MRERRAKTSILDLCWEQCFPWCDPRVIEERSDGDMVVVTWHCDPCGTGEQETRVDAASYAAYILIRTG